MRRKIALAIGLSLALAACATPSPTPTTERIQSFPPVLQPSPTAELAIPNCLTVDIESDGRVGKVMYRQGDEIWLMDVDTGERTLFPEGERLLEPYGRSPDRMWRAFAKEDGSLWVESADGGERNQIVPPGSGVRGSVYWMVSPVHWSPDGEWIAYLVARGEDGLGFPEYLGLWGIHPDGSEATEVYAASEGPVVEPKLLGWSTDSQYILFWSGFFSGSLDADGMELYAVPSKGGEPRSLGWTLGYPDFLAWSPGRTCLAIVEGGGREVWQGKQIVVVTPDGSARANLSNDPTRGDIQPAWSPDGEKLSYVSQRVPDKMPLFTEAIYATDIWVLNADGTEKRQLTFTENAGEYRPLWSPDGEHILFSRFENNTLSLWVMEADGNNELLIADMRGYPEENYYGHFNLTTLYAWYP